MSGYLIRQAPSYAGGTKGWEGVVDVRGKPGKFDWCDLSWKTCHKKPAASNLNVRLLFVRISTNLGGLEKSCCFPVLGGLCWTVHKHVLLFSFFRVFLSERLLCSPLCNGSTGEGMVIGDSEMVDKMTAGGKNCATYTMRQDLRGTDVTTNDCVMCLNMLSHTTIAFTHSVRLHQSFMTTTDDAEIFLKACGNSILVNFGAIKVSSRDSGLLVSNCSNVRTSPPYVPPSCHENLIKARISRKEPEKSWWKDDVVDTKANIKVTKVCTMFLRKLV